MKQEPARSDANAAAQAAARVAARAGARDTARAAHLVVDAGLTEDMQVFRELEAAQRRLDARRTQLLARMVGKAIGAGAGAGTEGGSGAGGSAGVDASSLEFRSLQLEISSVSQVSEHVAGDLLNTAYVLCQHYPKVEAALVAGEVPVRNAQVVVDAGHVLTTGHLDADRARRAVYEDAVLEQAASTTANRLRPVAVRLAAQASGALLEERHQVARKGRHVRVTAAGDGMADLRAHLPAEDAVAIADRLRMLRKHALNTETALDAQSAAAAVPRRTSGEVEADILRDLLLDGEIPLVEGAGFGIRGRVQVIVPVSALTGSEADGAGAGAGAGAGSSATVLPIPSEIVGYGPIDHHTARQIAGTVTSFDEVIVDSAGEVLSTKSRVPTAEMKRFIYARDLHCRAPGCRVPAHRCEIDHTIPWSEGGPTSTANLALLCKGHHDLKGNSGWEVTNENGGVLRWRGPHGTEQIERPPSRVRFEDIVLVAPTPHPKPTPEKPPDAWQPPETWQPPGTWTPTDSWDPSDSWTSPETGIPPDGSVPPPAGLKAEPGADPRSEPEHPF